MTSAGSFKVTVTDQFGCPGTGTINYTTTGGALTVLLNPAYICAGSDTPLSCTPGGGTGGAITYEWIAVNGDVTFDDLSAVQPKLAAATPPGVYKVKVKIKQGAQTVESAVVDITVGAQPKLATIGIFQNGNLIPDDGTSVLPGSKVSVVDKPACRYCLRLDSAGFGRVCFSRSTDGRECGVVEKCFDVL